MNLREKSRLYRTAHERIGARTPSHTGLKDLLFGYAQELRLTFTWAELDRELNYLAKEFLVLRESFRQPGPVLPALAIPQAEAPGPSTRLGFTPGAVARRLLDIPPRNADDFSRFFSMWRGHSYQDLRREFRREFTGDGRDEPARRVGAIDAEIIDALLRRLAAQPLDNPLDFVNDPKMGVLDAQTMAELYQRKTGA
jgi:hypothetical protein